LPVGIMVTGIPGQISMAHWPLTTVKCSHCVVPSLQISQVFGSV
jgi:hypothetical protein